MKGGAPTQRATPSPRRVLPSTGLTPAAITRTSTSFEMGAGISTSAQTSTSGPPKRVTWIARIDVSGGRQKDVLELCVVVQCVRPQLPTNARLLEAAERGRHADRAMGVDGDRAALQPARNAHRAAGVVGPVRTGEPVDRVVRDLESLVLVLEWDHHSDRTEDLLASGAVRVRDGRKDGRGEPVAGALGR